MSRNSVTDTTPALLHAAPSDALIRYVTGALETGISMVEVLPAQFEALRGGIPQENLLVRIRSREEYRQCLRLGARRFVSGMTVGVSGITQELSVENTQVLRSMAAEGLSPWSAYRISGLGDIMAGDYSAAFVRLTQLYGRGLCMNFSDKCSCATAAAYEWLAYGGGPVCAAFAGEGRSACLEELLAALNVIQNAGYFLKKLPRLRAAYESLAGTSVSRFKPVAGPNIFDVESGIHADGIFKNPLNYEPFLPESVGLRRRLVIGKHSGREALRRKLRELGIEVNETALVRINEAVRERSIVERRSLSDLEVRGICAQLRRKERDEP